MYFTGKFILDLADIAQQFGLDKAAVYDALSAPETEFSHDDSVVDYDGVVTVFTTLRAALKEPNIGLLMGENVNLRATRFIDRIMDQCSTVHEAFDHAVAYSRLISDAMICSLELSANHFTVYFDLNPDWAVRDDYTVSQVLNLALICSQNSLYRLTSQNFYPMEVNFFYPKPAKLNEHYRLFNCRLYFNRPTSSIVFRKNILERQSLHANLGLLGHLKTNAEKLLRKLPADPVFISTVKQAVLQNITPLSFDIEAVAQKLNMTPRTLQRKLKEQDTNFSRILSALRFQLVKKLMANGDANLDEIAYLVGYSEASALVRAFKGWTGRTPKQYLRNI